MRGIARLIQEPLILVDRTGHLLELNVQAKDLLGQHGLDLSSNLLVVVDGLRDLLTRTSGTAEPVIGALSFRSSDGVLIRFRAKAVVALRSEADLHFAVQLLDAAADKFSALSQRIEELNREILSRRAVQARLEEALSHNTILYRELQHRVKNHLQMMLGLFSGARREAKDAASRTAVENLELKLRAICEAQQAMYQNDDVAGVSADGLLNSLVKIFQALAKEGVQILVRADQIQIPNDLVFPLSLIVNELLSNALKHGPSGKDGHIEVSLRRLDDGFQLRVQDNGPGFALTDIPDRRSSGLGLVRGLCRQIGGQIDVGSSSGGLVIVRVASSR